MTASVSATVWALTALIALAVIGADLAWAFLRRNRQTSPRESVTWTAFYIISALAFGIFLLNWRGTLVAEEYYATWVTQYPLSIDNLFVFIIILTRLRIPRERQQLALLIGILFALFLRVIFLFVAIEAITRFIWLFFFFGGLLIYTAYQLVREDAGDDEWQEGRILSWLRTKGLRPFALAIFALGITDLLFALDSIPATVALTNDKYIAFMANAFAMMGLRQLYFLVEMALTRLAYLSKGLSVILAYIGFKLIIEAILGLGVEEVAGFAIPEPSLVFSMGVIFSALAVTAIISLRKSPERAPNPLD
ncbi:MAG: TerC family protein [Actinobacteria bacterium]|nr:TerC family protein [Actinomycetota bacterium]NCW34861.1 TerC family protein [Actinomycetota bacterium]NCZ73223.1 TerC family protein [Actinomycetota bacterium]NDA41312.1 TerC family protein [Actinomycetota bacterium]NDB31190.1 TerC family protein [Actinomycetota bacterium]